MKQQVIQFANCTKAFFFLSLTFLFSGISMNAMAQETLPPVTVVSLNYKYIKSVLDTSAAQPVRLLEQRAATYDVKNADFYEEDYEDFFVSFYLPAGRVLATYDKEGRIVKTAERFKNVALPSVVRQAVVKKYPGWAIAKDIYVVHYYSNDTKESTKTYKILLEEGTKRIRIKTNERGEFIE